MRLIGVFLMALALGPLAAFGASAVVCVSIEMEPTDIVPLWWWATAVAVFATGLVLVTRPKTGRKKR